MIKISGATGIDMNGASIIDASSVSATSVLENGVSVANETQLGLKANTADLKEIGVGQTWQDVTGSRSSNVAYTNSTGKPIEVVISAVSPSGSYWALYIETSVGSNVFNQIGRDSGNTSVASNISAIVPNGIKYKIANALGAGGATIINWSELR